MMNLLQIRWAALHRQPIELRSAPNRDLGDLSIEDPAARLGAGEPG
jgi:hypothetical protein